MKDARLPIPLTEVMKIVRLTSLFPEMLRLSSPRLRLRHDRRLVLNSRPILTLNLHTLSFVLSLAYLPPLVASSTVPLPGVAASVFADYLRSYFSVSQLKVLRSTARAPCLEESHPSICSLLSPGELLAAASVTNKQICVERIVFTYV